MKNDNFETTADHTLNYDDEVIGVVNSLSTTSNIKVNLIGNDFKENTKVTLCRKYEDGTSEEGIGRIGKYITEPTLPSVASINEVDHLNSMGIQTPNQNQREKIDSVINISCVKKSLPNGEIEIGGAFSNVPPKGTEIKKFSGVDPEIESSSPIKTSFYGYDISSDIPNINFMSSAEYRGDVNNKIFVGPMRSGKSVGIAECIKQNVPSSQNIIIFDAKRDFIGTGINNLNIENLSKKYNRKCKFINVENVVLPKSYENIKNISSVEGIYNPKMSLNLAPDKNNQFIDNLLKNLEDIFFHENSQNMSTDELKIEVRKKLTEYTKKDNNFFNRIYQGDGEEKKNKVQLFLDDVLAFDQFFDRLMKTRSRFTPNKISISIDEIINKICEIQNQTIVFYAEEYAPDSYMANTLAEFLAGIFTKISKRQKKVDIAIICDEAQEHFGKNLKFENAQMKVAKEKAQNSAIQIMSKLTAKGVSMWWGVPSITQLNTEIVKLASMHERYLFVGIDKSDREKLFNNVSDDIIYQYETLPKPRKHKSGALKTVYVLLVGDHSPYEPQGKGHLVRLCFDDIEAKVS